MSTTTRRREKMDENALKSLIDAQIRAAVGYDQDELAAEREENLRFYRGEGFNKVPEGRSSVVSRDVMDVVEWIMPSLMETFHGSDDVAVFVPSQPEDEAYAQQATDYVKLIYTSDNPGFLITHTALKDGLISKTGIVKHWWCEKTETKTARYAGLTDTELMVLLEEPSAEVDEWDVEQQQDGSALYTVQIRRTVKAGYVRIEPVPPEEFLTARRTKRLEDTEFCAHRTRTTRSALIAQGYDRALVDSLPKADDQLTEGEEERYEKEDSYDPRSVRTDPAMEEVTVTECYIRVDYDGDGVAELRKVKVAGANSNYLLDNEEIDEIPMTMWSPIMMPHTVWGQAVVDAVKDLQVIKSTLMRQMLDGLYLANNPRTEVVDNQVNLDDLLTNRPGGVVRVKAPGMMREITTNWPGAQAFPMVDYIDRVRDGRTGAGPGFTGLDPQALNNNAGADANSRMMSAAEQRVKLIARVFAEVFFKRLFRCILKLTARYQDRERIVRLRNQFVPVDPRTWNTDMDVSVKVGLGTGDKTLTFQALGLIAQKQEQIIMQLGPTNPLCDLKGYYNTLSEMVRTSGLPSVEPYFHDPEEPDPQTGQPREMPPKPPDPKLVEAQARAELEAQKLQMQAQADQQKAMLDAQIEERRIQQDMALRREQLGMEMSLKREQIGAEIALKREQLAAELQLKRELGLVNAATSAATSEVSPGGEPG